MACDKSLCEYREGCIRKFCLVELKKQEQPEISAQSSVQDKP